MDHIIPNMEDLIQQRLADIHIQIQNLKCQQNRTGKKNDLFNVYQQQIEHLRKQKEKVFQDIIDVLYDLGETYEYMKRSVSTLSDC